MIIYVPPPFSIQSTLFYHLCGHCWKGEERKSEEDDDPSLRIDVGSRCETKSHWRLARYPWSPLIELIKSVWSFDRAIINSIVRTKNHRSCWQPTTRAICKRRQYANNTDFLPCLISDFLTKVWIAWIELPYFHAMAMEFMLERGCERMELRDCRNYVLKFTSKFDKFRKLCVQYFLEHTAC